MAKTFKTFEQNTEEVHNLPEKFLHLIHAANAKLAATFLNK